MNPTKTFSVLLSCTICVAACNSANGSDTAPEPTAVASNVPAAATTAAATAAKSVPAAPKPGDLPAPDDVAKAPDDAIKTDSGLAYKILEPKGSQEKPFAWDKVEVHYTGWMTNGEMFDSSVKRGSPAQFPLNRVIKGWTEGLQLMAEGDKARFWIPGNLAYGDTPSRPGRPFGTLVFDVELIKIHRMPKPPEPPKVPEDVAAVPGNAKKTQSGLAYRVLKKGSGSAHPSPTSVVEVHYSGWMTNGKMFDSSVTRGQTATFPLNRVIKGWTEGLQLMVEGEKTRFWIPGELAYGNTPTQGGRPYGMLVFDVELVKIR